MENASADLLPITKVLLLIALTIWFAGTYHLVRLFIAHRAALARWEPERTTLHDTFKVMERQAMLFTNWPMVIIAIALSLVCLWMHPTYLEQPFFHALLGCGALLFAFHLAMHRLFRRNAKGDSGPSRLVLHLLALGPVTLLCAMIAIVALRDRLGWVVGSIGLLVILTIVTSWIASVRKGGKEAGDA